MRLPQIGEPMQRVEDARMVRGRGIYADDGRVPSAARAVVVRSPVAHARIVSVDGAAARAAPGVLAVLTGEDWLRDGLGPIPCVSIPATVMDGKWFRTPFPALQRDRVLCVGHAVALVVAETHQEALDAAELVRLTTTSFLPLPPWRRRLRLVRRRSGLNGPTISASCMSLAIVRAPRRHSRRQATLPTRAS